MEYKTKEEIVGVLHELLEWIGPLQDNIKKLKSDEFTIGETLAVADVVNALGELENALNEFDMVAEV